MPKGDGVSSVKHGLVSQGILSVREEHKPSATGQENVSFMSLKRVTKDKSYALCPNIICVVVFQDIFILAATECCQPEPNTKGF